MDCRPWVIRGGRPLKGDVTVSGSKHAALHLLGAAPLLNHPVSFENLPMIGDTLALIAAYESLGVKAQLANDGRRITVDCSNLQKSVKAVAESRRLRSSVLLLGAPLMRLGELVMETPGGDSIPNRDLRMFTVLLNAFGVEVSVQRRHIVAAGGRQTSGNRYFDLRTEPHRQTTGNNVTALALILAAANAGTTTYRGSLNVLEVRRLVSLLSAMGVRISNEPHDLTVVESEGLEALNAPTSPVIVPPDKVEPVLWAVAAVMTRGQVHIRLRHAGRDSLKAAREPSVAFYTDLLGRLGIKCTPMQEGFEVTSGSWEWQPQEITARYEGRDAEIVDGAPHLLPLLAITPGHHTWHDLYVGNARAKFASSINSIGGDVRVDGARLLVRGLSTLAPGELLSRDSRGCASLLLCALEAQGVSKLHEPWHAQRVYENLFGKLETLGARVERDS